MTRRIVLTGVWLGLVQTGLGYAVLVGAGSSILLFFATVTAWIAGGAIGATLKSGKPRVLLFIAGVGTIAATGILSTNAFSAVAACGGLVAGALSGIFAGRFIAMQSIQLSDARRVLFLENNGFTIGIATGLVLLFLDPVGLAAAATLLWGGLLAE